MHSKKTASSFIGMVKTVTLAFTSDKLIFVSGKLVRLIACIYCTLSYLNKLL